MREQPEPERTPMTRRVRQTFCEKLLLLPDMPSQARRDYLVRHLSLEFPGLRSVTRDENPHGDLMEIIAAASEYPGALRALWETVSFLYASDRRLDPIKDLVDAVDPEDLLRRDEQHSVIQLLAAAEPGVVVTAFHYSTRATLRDARLPPQDLAALVATVAGYRGRPDRLPPFFDFVDYVAHYRCHRSTRVRLHEWMDVVSQRLGFTGRSVIDNLCQATNDRIAASDRVYLIAELRPDKLRPGRFFLSASRQHGDDPEEVLDLDDRSVPLAEAITRAHDLMRDLAADGETASEERVLELILPRSLVTHAIDQWPVDPVLPAAIGTNYPLVLRSFDRLEDPSMHGDWGRNWRWLKQHDRLAGTDAIREIESHDLPATQALRAALLREGPPAGVLMLSPLPARQALGTDAFTAGLRGGAPIMVWSRDGATAQEVAASVREACAEGVLGLREHVFRLRLRTLEESGAPSSGAPSSEAPSPGADIALVFDDYDRIPERFRGRARLRSPDQRRPGY
jgi:vWA-MoxR associated protein C-terminal domain/vWA-MoxR associated protein middle region 0/Effector-associated domain 2